jgi:hypothetical protein
VIGVEMSVGDVAKSQTGLLGRGKIGRDIADRIDHGAGGLPAAS